MLYHFLKQSMAVCAVRNTHFIESLFFFLFFFFYFLSFSVDLEGIQTCQERERCVVCVV